MNTVALLLLLVTWSRKLNLAQSATTNFSQRVCDDHFRDGQFIIGGIVNVYEYNDIPCSGNLTDRLSFVEAIAYTIDLVNSRQDLLPNIDLGFEIRTDCGNEDIALWAAMTLAGSMGKLEFATTCPHNQRQTDKKVIAIVGTDRSSTSVFAAKVGGVFAIPVVSYHATSDDLSDSAKFPFFFRTVPPDKYQTNLIVDILLHFNWKYVALFYSLDSYGIHGSRQILSLAEKVGICVPITMPVSSKASEIKEIANSLIEHELVTVIISFSVPEYLHSVLLAIKTFNISRKFTFIGSDGWNPAEDMFQHFVDVLAGGIYIEFFSQHSTGFEEHYTKLTRNNDHASQWYKRKLKQSSIIANCTECSKVSVLKPHWNTQQVINAVYAIAYALNASLQEANLTTNIIDGWTLRKNLYGVTVSTNEASVQLDDNGEVAGKYLLSSWQIVNGVYQVVSIGTWDSSKKHSPLEIHEGLVQWGTPDNKVPVSLCVEECKPGYVQVPLEKKCCWGCQRCNDFAIVVTDNSSAFCQDCQPTHWPNKNYTKCLPIEPTFPHMHDIVFVLSGTATGFGFFLIILTLMGLCHYSEHPLIKASSRQLCRINLLGLTLSCVSVFLSFLKPTLATCVLSDAVISLAFCVTFTPILLKVNRIWRIFSLELGNELRFANNKSTITIVSLFIAAQVLIIAFSIPFKPSQPTLLIPAQRKPYLEIYCQFGYGFLSSGIYNSIIIIGCCCYAFKARKVPDNFNESKFIAVSVYSTLIVCLAAIPVYTTANNVAQKMGALSVVLLVNTYLTLSCLYMPKLYAIHFASEDIKKTWGPLSGIQNVSRFPPRLQPTSNKNIIHNVNTVKSVKGSPQSVVI